MGSYAIAWAWAFAFTQLVEVPVYLRLLRCTGVRAFGASALTHPLIWAVFPRLPLGYAYAVIACELFAWLAEAAYFARPYGLRRALWASLCANAASCVLGFISRALFNAP